MISPNAKQTLPTARTCHAVWRMARLESRRRARQAAIPPRVGASSLRTERYPNGTSSVARLLPSREREPPERKHLSRGRKRNQTRDSLSSSERNGNSPNRIPMPKGTGRCRVKGLASSSLTKLKLPEKARHRG